MAQSLHLIFSTKEIQLKARRKYEKHKYQSN